jgi:hypothetical protein
MRRVAPSLRDGCPTGSGCICGANPAMAEPVRCVTRPSCAINSPSECSSLKTPLWRHARSTSASRALRHGIRNASASSRGDPASVSHSSITEFALRYPAVDPSYPLLHLWDRRGAEDEGIALSATWYTAWPRPCSRVWRAAFVRPPRISATRHLEPGPNRPDLCHEPGSAVVLGPIARDCDGLVRERLDRHPGRDLQLGSADVRHARLWIPG